MRVPLGARFPAQHRQTAPARPSREAEAEVEAAQAAAVAVAVAVAGQKLELRVEAVRMAQASVRPAASVAP